MAATTSNKLSDKKRQEIIRKAQKELPDLDKQFQEAVKNLERISEGLRPR